MSIERSAPTIEVPTTNARTRPSATSREDYATGSVTARDGTTIGYRQFGHGPGLVLLHGTASSGYNHAQLAQALADAFTVTVPDRRGRGLSGPYGENDGIQTEVEDLDALLASTGAHDVFGVSSGGIIALQAALTLPAVHKVAIYEPPFFKNDSVTTALLRRFDAEMAEGRVAAALVTAMRGAQMGPPIFRAMPRWLSERLTTTFMNQQARKPQGGYVPMRALAPTMHYDFRIVVEMNARLQSFRGIRADVLLLGGSKSPAYLKAALDALEKVLPRARRVELAGLDHAASWNGDVGGHPEPVAEELRRFFG
jgi:pimeloyl-ACP methyl ester carboxylesterase